MMIRSVRHGATEPVSYTHLDVYKRQALLWPGHSGEELAEEFGELISDPKAAVFLAFQAGQAVGFAQCQLRQDYVEGTDSSPVGYLEGIYVREAHRGRGLARELVRHCEDLSLIHI